MRAFFCLLVLLMLLPVAQANELPQSKWTTYLSYGQFQPNLSGWDDGYDNDMRGWQSGLAYRVTDYIDVGFALSYLSASGHGVLPLNNSYGGEVNYALIPVDVYLALQGRFYPQQTFVPYLAGGYTQMYYKLDIAQQEDRKGKAHGHHYMLGIKASLNSLEPASAHQLQHAWGIDNSLLFLQAKWTEVKKNGLDLGGQAYSFGVMFEF